MKTLFISQKYRFYLKEWVSAQSETRGLLSQMAVFVECHNSHLSRVLKEEVHLTTDQAFRICEFMKLTEIETTYFMKMVEYERSGNIKYKQKLKNEMGQIRSDLENLQKRFAEDRIGNLERESLYYSNWFWSAIHIITDIPQFQTAKAIAERLSLNESHVRSCLEKLESFGLVTQAGDKWKLKTPFIHLPKSSPMNSVQHGNWRTRAILQSQNPNEIGLHYSVVQTVSLEDFKKIKTLLLSSLDSYRKVADPSKSEELVCLTIDFFKV